jgi:hypothetical protein
MQPENSLVETMIGLLNMLVALDVIRYTLWMIAKLFYQTSQLFQAGVHMSSFPITRTENTDNPATHC